MFAICIFAGHQFKITANSVIRLPYKMNNLPNTIWMSKVLLVATKNHTIIGQPTIKEAFVSAKVIQNSKNTLLHIQQIHI